MKWYVGQRVVCVKDHSQGVVRKGNEYIIHNVSISQCSCKYVLLDVGITSKNLFSSHTECGKRWLGDGTYWLNESLFAPLDDLSDYTIETLLNEIEIVNV